MHNDLPVLISGGGIGGLGAALALSRQGCAVTVLEQARARAVYTDEMVMHDALDETLVGRISVGAAFRKRFGNAHAVIHRADVHLSLMEGAQAGGRIEFATSTMAGRSTSASRVGTGQCRRTPPALAFNR